VANWAERENRDGPPRLESAFGPPARLDARSCVKELERLGFARPAGGDRMRTALVRFPAPRSPCRPVGTEVSFDSPASVRNQAPNLGSRKLMQAIDDQIGFS
jgi:hypothetical protein